MAHEGWVLKDLVELPFDCGYIALWKYMDWRLDRYLLFLHLFRRAKRVHIDCSSGLENYRILESSLPGPSER
ncbi:hypothetical protein BS78_07G084500 [Paspalum vaginatum]|nr:hypothetical protein BS78_07G084500 [Paspalum vaginatum]